MEQQVKELNERLTEETKRREGAEQQAGEINKQRTRLESEMGQLRQSVKP